MLFDEIVDLDLTLFRGIGKNHQRSFERNLVSTGRLNQSFNSTDSRSVLLSVGDDWKTFAMNNRRVPRELYTNCEDANAK
jgi:hypothetical protein